MKLPNPKFYGMPLLHRHRFWLWFLVVLTAGIILWSRIPVLKQSEVLVAVVAGSFGFLYFLRQQHMEEAKFFQELFCQFNRRYDRLNNKLFQHLGADNNKPFDEKQRVDFFDYFNLCAEEWLFYRAGYIYGPVWQAWCNGMRQFSKDARVLELWKEERGTESYYGFDFLRETSVDA